jgi:hypothetical protein
MHIASALTLVRRSPALDVPGSQNADTLGHMPGDAPPPTVVAPTRMRKALPGAILIAALVLLGALFPLTF